MKLYYCLANKDDEGNPWLVADWIGENCLKNKCVYISVQEVEDIG